MYLFSVDKSYLDLENINLVFEGLDTFADIFINNIKIGESKNMFVQYIFDVKNKINVSSKKIIAN